MSGRGNTCAAERKERLMSYAEKQKKGGNKGGVGGREDSDEQNDELTIEFEPPPEAQKYTKSA